MIAYHDSVPVGGVERSPDKRAARVRESMPPCPRAGCRGRLSPYPTPQGSYDSVTGLAHHRCGMCGHHGMRVPNGLHLVFIGPDEYVFHYPPSLASLTISVSPAILARFPRHRFTQMQLIRFMAEWVLLTGRASGVIRFAVETIVLKDCYDYLRRHILHERQAENA